jgi:Protein of unknown function (DUF3592)
MFMDTLSVLLLVIGMTCLIFGLRSLFTYLIFSYRARARLAWPEISGRVIARELQPEDVRSPYGVTLTRYYVEVQYTYKVKGAAYKGAFDLGQAYKSEEEAKQAAEAYPNGTPVTLRYNPKKPQKHIDREDKQTPPKLLPAVLLLVAGLGSVILGMF